MIVADMVAAIVLMGEEGAQRALRWSGRERIVKTRMAKGEGKSKKILRPVRGS
jgi:hypothetical protein